VYYLFNNDQDHFNVLPHLVIAIYCLSLEVAFISDNFMIEFSCEFNLVINQHIEIFDELRLKLRCAHTQNRHRLAGLKNLRARCSPLKIFK
jgi:hypothetical protein